MKINQPYNKEIETQAKKNLEKVAQASPGILDFNIIYEVNER